MKNFFLLLALSAAPIVAGCAGPSITAFSESNITLKHDPSLYRFSTVQAKADALCSEHYDKKAVHVLTDPENPLFIQHSTFRCE